jgi:hypothetical protein
VQETGRRFVEGHPEIYVVSNVIENGVPIGSLGAGEAVWHTDMSYLENPPKASMLYALEVPPAGGDTHFCNMYRAYECAAGCAEAARFRARSQTRRHLQQRRLCAPGVAATDDPVSSPACIIRWSARIRRPAGARLYLGRRRNAYIGDCRWRSPKRCSMNCGRTRRAMTSLGTTNGNRRRRPVGQPLHHASARLLRSKLAPDPIPHANQERAGEAV